MVECAAILTRSGHEYAVHCQRHWAQFARDARRQLKGTPALQQNDIQLVNLKKKKNMQIENQT